MNTIIIDRQKITSADINQYKDFQDLMDRFSHIPAKTTVKKRWHKFGIPVISVLVLSFCVWFVIIPFADYKNTKSKLAEEFSFINPPLPQANIPASIILIKNLNDTVIHIPPFVYIELKRNSLTDSSNSLVNSNIELHLRQFMNPVEIFLSGIPMVYDSAGIRSTFESAGMIEIFAFCRKKPLFIVPDKPIRITYKSMQTSNDYNLYYLDTTRRNWIYKGEDGIVMQEEMPLLEQVESEEITDPWMDSLNKIRSTIADLQLQKPELPVLASSKKWHFKIDILENEFPELSVYKKTVFEIDESYRPLNPSHPAILWEDVIISRSETPMHYYVTFKKDTLAVKYKVCPVLTGEPYKVALRKYEDLFSDYQLELTKRKEREEQILRQVVYRRTLQSRDSAARENYKSSRRSETYVIRSFEILNFGIWNYDKPLTYNKMLSMSPIIMVNDTIFSKTFYLADLTRNALITVNSGNKLVFEEDSKNIIWMITDKNKIAVYTAEDFSSIPARNESFTFHMREINTQVNSPEDFLELFHADFREGIK
jgi:hypothetical protein